MNHNYMSLTGSAGAAAQRSNALRSTAARMWDAERQSGRGPDRPGYGQAAARLRQGTLPGRSISAEAGLQKRTRGTHTHRKVLGDL